MAQPSLNEKAETFMDSVYRMIAVESCVSPKCLSLADQEPEESHASVLRCLLPPNLHKLLVRLPASTGARLFSEFMEFF